MKRLGVLTTLISLVLGLAGCGIQDSTQPPENSISVMRPRSQTPALDKAKIALKFRRAQSAR